MLHSALVKLVPHRVLHIPGIKHSFDVLERAYLLHWSLELATMTAVGIAIATVIVTNFLLAEE